ncbi:hypothetical protein [Aquimarina muelleri]|uniref:Uncharacterized protein n=1 Tax=Aquimarina muelleri TaxID=279356 RepID=A0A918N4I5_9FLAO|nr:hypothetical protein [Aquimarina muelleri]MCX2764409.1 hypothetical protein [Aquimarina muelleri]GGX21136.1 hypothetical protein GCM10007384_22940 [Aquimarina muelleri]
MKKINMSTYFTTFILLFILAVICSLIGYANDKGTLVFTPTTEFLMKLHSLFKFPTDIIGYSGVVRNIYGIAGGLTLSVLLYSLVFERFVFFVKSLRRGLF